MNAAGRSVRQSAVAGEVFPNESRINASPITTGVGRVRMAGLCRLWLHLLADLRAPLSAIQAFPAIRFQTQWDSVISLDLTGIIAFDAVCEWEAARRLRCGVPGMAGKGAAFTHGKKIQVCL